MRSAAGTYICSRKCHNAHLSMQFLFAPVLQLFHLFLRIQADIDWHIFPYDLVGTKFQKPHILQRKFSGKINSHPVSTHMKSDIFKTEFFMHQSAHDMLPGMVLHQIKTIRPVNSSRYRSPRLQRTIRIMHHLTIFLMSIRNHDQILFHRNQHTSVSRLPATLRIKGTPVQRNLIAVLSLFAVCDCRQKFLAIHIRVIQSFCHMFFHLSSLSGMESKSSFLRMSTCCS